MCSRTPYMFSMFEDVWKEKEYLTLMHNNLFILQWILYCRSIQDQIMHKSNTSNIYNLQKVMASVVQDFIL